MHTPTPTHNVCVCVHTHTSTYTYMRVCVFVSRCQVTQIIQIIIQPLPFVCHSSIVICYSDGNKYIGA